MKSGSTIIFAGGGTGGHLYPGVAVAAALKKQQPDLKILFLCTTRQIDQIILEPTGFEFIAQPIVPPEKSVGGMLKFWKSWRDTKDLVSKILKERSPAAVIGLGGYAAGVAVKLAGSKKIPAALINPDMIPGKANQYLLKFVQHIFCQFDATAQYIPAGARSKMVVTGCPIRTDLLHLPDRLEALKNLGLDPVLQTLVVTGASQGAKTVNEAILEVFKTFQPQGWQVLHLAGREHAEAVRSGYRDLPNAVSVRVIDFTSNMADVWAVADVVISRSGASSCAEVVAVGVPSILMPYPFHKDKHQRLNAEVLQSAGAAILMDDLKDAKANAATLLPLLQSLLFDSAKRQGMMDAAKKITKVDADQAVADAILKMVG